MSGGQQDFLTLLRRSASAGRSLKDPGELSIQLRIKNDEGFIVLVDRYGNACRAADYAATGAMGPLLRTVAQISGRGTDISWGASPIAGSVSLARYPFLMRLIEPCAGRLVDSKMKPLAFDRTPVPTILRIKVTGDEAGGTAECTPEFTAGGNHVLVFLGPEHVFSKKGVVTVEPLGDRFADLRAFYSPFRPAMAESYFSILFSSATGVTVEYGGRKVKFTADAVECVPTLIIEKIDVDNALYLRVAEAVGSLPLDITSNFALTHIASVTDHHIYVRPIAGSDINAKADHIYAAITKPVSRKEAKEVWREGNLFVIPQGVASQFLMNSFAALIAEYRIVGAEKLKSYRIVAAAPKLNVRFSSGIDFLEGSASVDVAGQQFSLSDLIAQYSRNKYITLSDGNRAVIDDNYMRRLQRIFRNPDSDGRVKVSFFDLPETMELLDAKERELPVFDSYRKFYEGFNALSSRKLRTQGLNATLRSYQKEGVKWLDYLYQSGMGGCLADDMGLGKTVQTIALIVSKIPAASAPMLIVMPRSLLFNWAEEFRRFAPEVIVATHYGTDRRLDQSMKAQVILTSYATVRNDIEEFLKVEFDTIVLDESQNIKNVDALTTKAVWMLKAAHRLAISGTPIENNLTELYSLFHFLNPAMFGSLNDFNKVYTLPIQKEGNEEAAHALRRKIFPFMLRRLKSEVLKDLPDLTEQVLEVEMSPAQARLYEERRAYFAGEIGEAIAKVGVKKASFEMLQALNELRQIASIPEEKSNGTVNSPKIDVLMDYLLMAVRNGHKVVVFYNFLAGIELTAERLEREGIGFETMTGATRNRKEAVDRFQNDPECRVMLMTVKTGGVGLNLVAADTVFVAEPWWNKAAELQAINRLHRIGQKNAVNCYYLITAGTIEEKIRQLQEQKSQLVDAVISSDSTGSKALTADDIAFLLS